MPKLKKVSAPLLIVFIFAAILFPITGNAVDSTKSCSKDIICVIVERNGRNVDFLVENKHAYDITLSINVSPVNLETDVSYPYMASFKGNAVTKAFSLKIKDSLKNWECPYTYRWIIGRSDAVHDDSYTYALPFDQQSNYQITQGFNGKFTHTGEQKYAIDWAMPEGTLIYAARSGIVVDIQDGNDLHGPDLSFRDYANFIRIRHSDGTIGEYAHLQQHGARVRIGQLVNEGDIIGLSGNTGQTTGPHLHFWVYKAADCFHRISFPIKFKVNQKMQMDTNS